MPGSAHSEVFETVETFGQVMDDPAIGYVRRVEMRAAPLSLWWHVLQARPDLTAWVAASRHAPAEIIAHLASHPLIPVRAVIASGCTMSEPVMLQLAYDKSELIRVRLVCNPRLTARVVETLALDACQLVAARAQARLEHDITGTSLSLSYLDGLPLRSMLH